MMLQEILEQCRSNLGTVPRRMDEEEYFSHLAIHAPSWLTSRDKFTLFFRYQWSLFTEGVIVWGHLVQANQLMFRPGNSNSGGEVVYCLNTEQVVDIEELRGVSKRLYSLKGQKSLKENAQEIGDYLENERIRVFGLPVPETISPQFPCHMTSVLFDRRHLPDGMLSSNLFPLLVQPEPPHVAMVLPCLYWPEVMTDNWG